MSPAPAADRLGSRPAGRKVVLLLGNPFLADSRSWKLARSLAERGHTVTVVARWKPGLPPDEIVDGTHVIRLPEPRLGRLGAPRLPGGTRADERTIPSPGTSATDHHPARVIVRALSGARRRAGSLVVETLGRLVQGVRYLMFARLSAAGIDRAVGAADVWQAEGLVQLPIALELRRRRGGIVVYDSRDLDSQSARFARLPRLWRRLLMARERGWARSADAIVTANQPYAAAIEASTGRRPTIVWNGPLAPDPTQSRTAHEALGLPLDTRIVLALGQLAPDRGLEELCAAIGEVPGVVLVLVGSGTLEDHIRGLAASMPWADRIRVHPAISPAAIPAWTASAEVAAMPIRGTTLNHRLTTPTRLFDALGAGVPVVAGDLPGMAEIVRTTGCGVLCDPDDPASIAVAIRTILQATPERRAEYRRACLAAALGTFAWGRQVDVLLGVYGSALRASGPERSGIVPP